MDADQVVARVAREESGRIVAAVMRVVGDLERAEEIVQEAFASALEHWRGSKSPDNPGAWITRVARNRALDELRHGRHVQSHEAEVRHTSEEASEGEMAASEDIPDERLRLIFLCCHPELPREQRVALTLRMVGGLGTDELAHAFLVPEPTMAQRLVRAKKAIRDRRLPYVVPEPSQFEERLESVLEVLYLIFNGGYAAATGEHLQRVDLCSEAIRLTEVLTKLAPQASDAWGLLALMKFHASRDATRVEPSGKIILLEHQDRTRWDRALIVEAGAHFRRALALSETPGPYALQAAIAGVHAASPSWEETNWREIVGYYEAMLQQVESPIVALNHAVAVSYAEGPQTAVGLLASLRNDLDGYHYFHAFRAELYQRLGQPEIAAGALKQALTLVKNASERELLEDRLRRLTE